MEQDSLYITKSCYQYAFFSQMKFDYNKANLTSNIIEMIKSNKYYPSVCTLFYGAYYLLDNDLIVLATNVSSLPDLQLLDKYKDYILLGKIKKFSHYPYEIMKPNDYDDPTTQYYLRLIVN